VLTEKKLGGGQNNQNEIWAMDFRYGGLAVSRATIKKLISLLFKI
jgi:hypothetical protein